MCLPQSTGFDQIWGSGFTDQGVGFRVEVLIQCLSVG